MRILIAFFLLAAPAAAQIDLPDRPVKPPKGSPPVEVPAARRGDLAERMTGKGEESVGAVAI